MTDPITSNGSRGQVPAATLGPVPFVFGPPGAGEVSTPAAGGPSPQQDSGPALVVDVAALAKESAGPKAPPSLEEATQAFRDYLKGLPSNLLFKADTDSGLYMFKVVNPITQEVIRQFPPDEVLEMAKRLKEQLAKGSAGILLDEKL